MTAKGVRHSMLLLWGVYGLLIGLFGDEEFKLPKVVDYAHLVSVVGLTYFWYYLDATERNYQRSGLMGAAIILIPLLSVPYYLYKSRPDGEGGKAIAGFVGFCVTALAVSTVAGVLGAVLARG